MTAKEKRELLVLPIATPPGIDVPAIITHTEKTYSGETYTREIHNHRYRVTQHDNVACMTLFAHDGKPLFRTFQSADDLVSQYLNEDKPRESNATIWGTNATIPTYGYYNMWHGTAEDDELLYTLLAGKAPLYLHRNKKPDDNGYDFLCNYQARLREYQTKQKHDKIRAELDSHMLEIRPLPQKVKDWVRSTVMRHSRYLLYDYRKGTKTMTAVCTHCGRTVQLKKPHHMAEGRCPVCHTTATCVAKGKHSNYARLTDRSEFAYLQSTKAGWCVRYFDVTVDHLVHAPTYDGGTYYYQERNRDFYRRGETMPEKCFAWENFKNTGSFCFCHSYSSGCGSKVMIYPGNLDELLRPADPYTPYRDIAAKCGKISPVLLIRKAPEIRQIEYLYKLKLYQLARQTINGENVVNLKANNVADVLGVFKQDIKQVQAFNPCGDELRMYREIRKKGLTVDVTALRWLYINAGMGLYGEKIPDIPLSLGSIQRYIEKQRNLRTNVQRALPSTLHRVCTEIRKDWCDYIRECKQLKLDLKDDAVLRPNDLAVAHTRTSGMIVAKNNAKANSDIKRLAAKLAKTYSYENGGLLIRPLASFVEVLQEGKELSHCVGGYADTYSTGSTYLFCIRRAAEPDKPFYTLQLSPAGKVQQYRGYKNDINRGHKPLPEVEAFVNKWVKKVVTPAQETDKKPKRDKVPA